MNNIYYRGRELNADIVLFGHTHQQLVEKEDDMILMNPGSISLPKFKGRCIGFINIDNNGEVDAYLKEIRE
jgi:hypothetical protein